MKLRFSLEFILSIVTIIALIVVFGFLGYTWWRGRVSQDDRSKIFEEAAIGGKVPSRDERDMIKIAEKFVGYYQDALLNDNEKDGERARELLTERAQSVVDLGGTRASGLRKFTLETEAPNEIKVGEVVRQSERFAEVSSQWVYDVETIERYFYFVREGEDDDWKLDSIQLMRQ